MAQIIDRMRLKGGAAVVENFNRQFTPNTPCFYQPTRGIDKWYPTRTRSEAWMLGHGEPVVQIDGTSGCVSIEHLAMPGSERYEAAIAESEAARNEAGSAENGAAPTEARSFIVFMADLYGALLKADASPDVLNIVDEYRKFAGQLQELGLFADGYHTFNELYAHRVRLFSALMNAHPEWSWWSHKHSDGTQWAGWIIAGIHTPDGMVTYHLPVTEIENLPDGCELPKGREWDGHTADDVLSRLTSLGGPSRYLPTPDDEEEEHMVYQYAASVNLPQGQIHYDGILTGPLITGIESYLQYRAQIAADVKAQVDQVQVHSLTMVGFKAAH